jgi:hypothetical protein
MTTQQTELNQQIALSVDDEGDSETPVVTTETPSEAPVAAESPIETVAPEPTAPADSPSPAAEEIPQSPFELPYELAATPPPPEPAGLVNVEREELARLRQGQAEMAQFQAVQQSEAELQELQQQYEALNMDPETARWVANEVRKERRKGEQQVQQMHLLGQVEQGRRNAAVHYGGQYGVAPSALVSFNTPQDMERYAQLLAHQGKQERRLTSLERSQVPEQHFDGGQGAAGGPLSGEALEVAIGNGTAELTPERMRQLQDYHKTQGHGG